MKWYPCRISEIWQKSFPRSLHRAVIPNLLCKVSDMHTMVDLPPPELSPTDNIYFFKDLLISPPICNFLCKLSNFERQHGNPASKHKQKVNLDSLTYKNSKKWPFLLFLGPKGPWIHQLICINSVPSVFINPGRSGQKKTLWRKT